MVWKARALHLEGSIEVIETSTFPYLKIHSSEASFELVYDLGKSSFDPSRKEEKRVRFAEEKEWFMIENRREIPSGDRHALWFRKSELKSMRKREDDGEVDAGYEQIIKNDPPQNDELQEALHQLMAVSVVLEEQARQREERISDPELISEKYRNFIQRSRRSMFISNLARIEEKKQAKGRPLQIITDESISINVESL